MLNLLFSFTFVWFWVLKTCTCWIPKVNTFTRRLFMIHEFIRLFRELPIKLLAISKVRQELRRLSAGCEEAAVLASKYVEFTEDSIAIHSKFYYYSQVAGYFQMSLED